MVVPGAGPNPSQRPAGGLLTRVIVGAALAAVAIAAVWVGGVAFTALVATACLLMSAEWSVMHGIARGFRVTSLAALAFVAGVTVYVSAADALIVLAASAGAIGLFMRGFDRNRAFWVAAGLLYCGLPMISLLWLRAQPHGLGIVAWTFGIVWTTDIAAYFAGRAIGGPKLAPGISPNKTIAGLLAGLAAAALFAGLAAGLLGEQFTRSIIPLMLGGLGAALAFTAQLGDLFESGLKRRAGVKDSGKLLPGHGGVMDRIDGLIPVCILVAVSVSAAPPEIWQ